MKKDWQEYAVDNGLTGETEVVPSMEVQKMTDNETAALNMSNNKRLLLKQLRAAVSVLSAGYQAEFSPQSKQSFDAEAKRLYGSNGFYLQWQTRSDPNAPISYNNQQTNVGCCILYHAVAAS